jgi:putative hemolysin
MSWWITGLSFTAYRQIMLEKMENRAFSPEALLPMSGVPEEIRAGSLAVRLATTSGEIEASQFLRYDMFYRETGGTPPPEVAAQRRDFDAYDDICDHLLVIDYDRETIRERVVGTYRLIRRDAVGRLGRFYTESEFDIAKIRAFPGNILELGRSCVHPDYRNRAVMQLLWRGIGAYVAHYSLGLMFGCASFTGQNPDDHAMGLSYLYHYHLAPEYLRARALPELYVNMNRMPKEAINAKQAFLDLPPLLKGYLRLGGYIGDGAIIDPHCNMVDVCIIVQTDRVTDKYYQRYSPGA